ncbi:MarR family winged helix-turn-helix transcriptional regulator [Aurantiacibacter rhizosphaerae]|uniref:Winged helix DNA-binding protein n=1 Tax=Aurantiacibacter rhizosphaerae TaxID=2691582 RepID=A0A844XHR8_9SPHN|nr:MarR family winged helix-turn-helix transcriptional regulator [Aurantiacibacter rhizosphaerae]MWV29095.1 winged helix DNA-binding protein [Aurantiacibacter rhizosphaerae]
MAKNNDRLGRMFGDAYELWQRETYGGLAADGMSDIRPAHSPVFRHISARGSRVVDLAQLAGMTKQSMAYLVNSLAEAGYVQVESDPQDGRARLVRLTAKGEQADKTLASRSRAFEARVQHSIGAERMEDLKSLVAAVLDAHGGDLDR